MRILFAFILLLFLTGCEKEQRESLCKEQQAIFISADETKIKQVITQAINSLPSRAHTQQNLTALTTLLTNDCGINAKVLCFGCIKTLPEQSEIRLSVTDGASMVNKTVDISATSTTNQIMKFVALHD